MYYQNPYSNDPVAQYSGQQPSFGYYTGPSAAPQHRHTNMFVDTLPTFMEGMHDRIEAEQQYLKSLYKHFHQSAAIMTALKNGVISRSFKQIEQNFSEDEYATVVRGGLDALTHLELNTQQSPAFIKLFKLGVITNVDSYLLAVAQMKPSPAMLTAPPYLTYDRGTLNPHAPFGLSMGGSDPLVMYPSLNLSLIQQPSEEGYVVYDVPLALLMQFKTSTLSDELDSDPCPPRFMLSHSDFIDGVISFHENAKQSKQAPAAE